MTTKQIFPIVCMALIGASCSDEVTSVNSTPVQMTFNVSVDEAISRAGSSENLPTRAFMYVSDNNGTVLASAAEGTKENDSFKFSIELDRSASYTVAFWADKGGYIIDATAGLKKIGYENASNLYPSVGFADCLTNFSPNDGTTQYVELKHAVGQIVINETETLAAGDKVKISFTRNNYIYSAADQTYTLTDTDTPAEFEFTATETVNKGDIISAYMLAPNDEQKAGTAPSMLIRDFKLTYTHSGESKAYERAISYVPIKSNSRTVISGSMEKLAKVNQSFSISFDTSWNDDLTPSDSDETPSTPPTDDDNDDTSDAPVINLTSAGSLTESMLTDAIGAGNSLKITGAMSDNDFKTLCKYLSQSSVGGTKHLSLDLSEARFTTMPNCAFLNSTLDDIYGKKNSAPVSGLSKIILPEGLAAIPDGAFADCVNLSQITIPTTVTAIGEMSFYRSGLTTLNATSVTTVGGNACEGCGSLTTVTLGNLTEISNNSFKGCTLLTTFDITRCTSVPTDGNVIFGGKDDPIKNLTIYVANESIRASLSSNSYWTTQNPTFVVGAPSGN